MCESGARSPEAPSEPFCGITGVTPRLSISTSFSTTTSLTPLIPAQRALALRSIMPLTCSSLYGSPVAVQWLSTRLVESFPAISSGTALLAKSPKPVVIP